MSYQVTEQNFLLIYGIIVLLKINIPVALVIHFPPIPMSLTSSWESQLVNYTSEALGNLSQKKKQQTPDQKNPIKNNQIN